MVTIKLSPIQVRFLKTAIEFQEHYGTVWADDMDDKEYRECLGFSKKRATAAIQNLKNQLNEKRR